MRANCNDGQFGFGQETLLSGPDTIKPIAAKLTLGAMQLLTFALRRPLRSRAISFAGKVTKETSSRTSIAMVGTVNARDVWQKTHQSVSKSPSTKY